MNEKLGILCCAGQKNYGHAEAFFANLKNFPPKHELIVYSEHNWSDQWPMVYKLNAPLSVAKTEKNRMAIYNLVFFAGLRIAAMKRFTHIMVLEIDCRVNIAGWDDIIWNEFLGKNPNAISGGTLIVFNPCSFNKKASENFESLLVSSKQNRLLPMSVFGTSAPAQHRDSCVFATGAFSIHRMDWLLKTFPEVLGTPKQYIELAQSIKSWDYEIGTRLWKEFKEESYNNIVNLESVYSGYGNLACSEEERKQWLSEKMVVGIHQIKSNWPGPIPNAPSISNAIPAITAVTCTGDRPEAFALCEKWMSRQTKKPDQWIVLDDGNVPTKCTMGQQYIPCQNLYGEGSLVNKLKMLYTDDLVKCDAISFIEDDDWYSPKWIEFCSQNLFENDLIGEGRAFYYNISKRWYYKHDNMEHSSLCSTAMRSSLLPTLFNECGIINPFIDSRLWRDVPNRKKVFDPLKHADKKRLVVGMKGFPGRTGYGSGHVVRDKNAVDDIDMEILKLLVGGDFKEYEKFRK